MDKRLCVARKVLELVSHVRMILSQQYHSVTVTVYIITATLLEPVYRLILNCTSKSKQKIKIDMDTVLNQYKIREKELIN